MPLFFSPSLPSLFHFSFHPSSLPFLPLCPSFFLLFPSLHSLEPSGAGAAEWLELAQLRCPPGAQAGLGDPRGAVWPMCMVPSSRLSAPCSHVWLRLQTRRGDLGAGEVEPRLSQGARGRDPPPTCSWKGSEWPLGSASGMCPETPIASSAGPGRCLPRSSWSVPQGPSLGTGYPSSGQPFSYMSPLHFTLFSLENIHQV